MTAVEDDTSTQERLELVASDLYGGAEEEEFQVIRSMGELQKFYRKVNMTRKPGLPVPRIDFSRQTAILYCSGKTNATDIPELYVQSESDSTFVVRKKSITPADNPTASTATVTPFGLYLLPFTDKQVVFDQK